MVEEQEKPTRGRPKATVTTQDEWDAQTPCPECGGRPGYNPATGVQLLTGHLYQCSLRPQ
jgi:hypothetical protein